ncbi:MAG: hypothetical protein M1819_002309 [Sarea resinae]|nr:MAG: hypothetical protein M1819_002309 [Sarea resinae]
MDRPQPDDDEPARVEPFVESPALQVPSSDEIPSDQNFSVPAVIHCQDGPPHHPLFLGKFKGVEPGIKLRLAFNNHPLHLSNVEIRVNIRYCSSSSISQVPQKVIEDQAAVRYTSDQIEAIEICRVALEPSDTTCLPPAELAAVDAELDHHLRQNLIYRCQVRLRAGAAVRYAYNLFNSTQYGDQTASVQAVREHLRAAASVLTLYVKGDIKVPQHAAALSARLDAEHTAPPLYGWFRTHRTRIFQQVGDSEHLPRSSRPRILPRQVPSPPSTSTSW